mmetsp:Transcript_37710/g.92687  ORF Transcript_37710/g.92687 Transcript_37710/m.92687 type:complete len:233 (+) Transcript_37710:142-840(+)
MRAHTHNPRSLLVELPVQIREQAALIGIRGRGRPRPLRGGRALLGDFLQDLHVLGLLYGILCGLLRHLCPVPRDPLKGLTVGEGVDDPPMDHRREGGDQPDQEVLHHPARSLLLLPLPPPRAFAPSPPTSPCEHAPRRPSGSGKNERQRLRRPALPALLQSRPSRPVERSTASTPSKQHARGQSSKASAFAPTPAKPGGGFHDQVWREVSVCKTTTRESTRRPTPPGRLSSN